MTRDDVTVLAHQDWVGKAECADAAGHFCDLRVGVSPGNLALLLSWKLSKLPCGFDRNFTSLDRANEFGCSFREDMLSVRTDCESRSAIFRQHPH
jgi:hypothetical protein